MKTHRANRKGFVLLFVIAMFGLINLYMIIMTSDANGLIFQADKCYLEACKQNLIASGLNWAKKNVNTATTPAGVIEMDTADMNIRKSALSLTFAVREKDAVQVEINTSCTRGRHTINSLDKFTVETRQVQQH
jgi:hypothetical protein